MGNFLLHVNGFIGRFFIKFGLSFEGLFPFKKNLIRLKLFL